METLLCSGSKPMVVCSGLAVSTLLCPWERYLAVVFLAGGRDASSQFRSRYEHKGVLGNGG